MKKKILAMAILTLCSFASVAQADTCRSRYEACMEGSTSDITKPNCEVYTPKEEGPTASRGYTVCNSQYVKQKSKPSIKDLACMAGCMANFNADQACEGTCSRLKE